MKNAEFLGMDITFIGNKTVEIRMDTYLEECPELFGERITRGAATPVKKDLFDVNDGDKGL